jgi:hypothetical protein
VDDAALLQEQRGEGAAGGEELGVIGTLDGATISAASARGASASVSARARPAVKIRIKRLPSLELRSKPPCPGLCRAPTSFLPQCAARQDVDGRDKPGHGAVFG